MVPKMANEYGDDVGGGYIRPAGWHPLKTQNVLRHDISLPNRVRYSFAHFVALIRASSQRT